MNSLQAGDHIEKIDDKSMVGLRHFEVAKALKDIEVGTTFTIRLIEPFKDGFRKWIKTMKIIVAKTYFPYARNDRSEQ